MGWQTVVVCGLRCGGLVVFVCEGYGFWMLSVRGEEEDDGIQDFVMLLMSDPLS